VRRHFPYRKIATALMLLVVSVTLMNITGKPEDGLSFWESIFNKVAKPLYDTYFALQVRYRDASLTFQDKKDLLLENQRLRKELEALHALLAENEELRKENERLTGLLDVKDVAQGEYKVATVIGREPNKWFATITIELGANDGVKVGASVLETKGLVGRVLKVGETSSQVLLLTDPDSGVGALVQRSRDHGLVLGGNGSESVTLRLFSKDADVKEGDVVITSGMGSKYPAGVIIGEVESVYVPSPGLVKEAIVRPAADINHLEEVMVVILP
jgi:rod shape-determining protein MreC